MKIFGTILIILQGIAILGSIMTNEYLEMFLELASVRGLGNFIGFHIIGFVGVLLLINGIKKEKRIK